MTVEPLPNTKILMQDNIFLKTEVFLVSSSILTFLSLKDKNKTRSRKTDFVKRFCFVAIGFRFL